MKAILSKSALFQMIRLTTEGMHPVVKVLTYTLLLIIFFAATFLGLAVFKMLLLGQAAPEINIG